MKKIWEDPQQLHENILEPRAYFFSYGKREDALSYKREKSLGFQYLTGQWNFQFFNNPGYCTGDLVRCGVDRIQWDTI